MKVIIKGGVYNADGGACTSARDCLAAIEGVRLEAGNPPDFMVRIDSTDARADALDELMELLDENEIRFTTT